MAYEKTLCSGCGLPKSDTFDPGAEDHYEVEVIKCFACAARDRKAWNRNTGRDAGVPPDHGVYYAITGRDDE